MSAFVVAAGAAASAEPLVVAVPAPLTGARSALGLSIHTAASTIAAEIESGQRPGRPLKLLLVDDGCGVGTPMATGAAVVVGHPCARTASAAALAYAKAGQVFVAAGAGVSRRVQALRLPASSDQGDALGRHVADMVQRAGVRQVAVVRDKTQLNRGLAARIDTMLKAHGVVVVTEVFNGGDKVFTAMAERLAQAGLKHVVLLAFAVEGAFAALDLVKAIPDLEIFGPDHLAQRDFGTLAGAASSRVRVMLPPTLDAYAARHPAAGVLRDRLTAVGINPTREAIETAAGLEAVAAAAADAADHGAAALIAALKIPRQTILGPIAFDADGNALMPYWTVHSWRDGALVAMP